MPFKCQRRGIKLCRAPARPAPCCRGRRPHALQPRQCRAPSCPGGATAAEGTGARPAVGCVGLCAPPLLLTQTTFLGPQHLPGPTGGRPCSRQRHAGQCGGRRCQVSRHRSAAAAALVSPGRPRPRPGVSRPVTYATVPRLDAAPPRTLSTPHTDTYRPERMRGAVEEAAR